jgi:hypothetical protein
VIDPNFTLDGETEPAKFPYYLVGDEIFALKSYLMRPYPGQKSAHLPEEQAVFNYRLSRARRVIEQAFGILRARWRIFKGPITAQPDNVIRYVLAACTLHNYLMQTENCKYCPTFMVDRDDGVNFRPGEWRGMNGDDNDDNNGLLRPLPNSRGHRYHDKAMEMRNNLKTYLNSDQGSVSWQLGHVRRTGHIDEDDDDDDDDDDDVFET